LTADANIMELKMTTSPQTTPQDNDASASPGGPRLGIAGRVGAWVFMIAAGLVVLGLVAITIGPRFLPYQALLVRSGSMSPTIPTGSIVFYTKIPSAKVKVGDVIVFTKPGDATEKVTHRVYQIGHSATGAYFTTKGDANGTPDDWRVPAVGTGWIARFHVPSIGYALVYLQSTLARLLLLVIPAILLGAITLYEIWQDRARGPAAT
jgi:signal peptidase I